MNYYKTIEICLFYILLVLPLVFGGLLRNNFYKRTCPQAETTVQQLVQRRFAVDRSVTAALLRMHYHDCFVRGCDASILIDSTPNSQAEKAAGANLGVREFELIDTIKSRLEEICPQTVSCSDIIALATRDAVALARGPVYNVPTGRRDGLISSSNEVIMPGPSSTVSDAQRAFKEKGLTLRDMVLLLGGHTVGTAHCTFFRDRISNFQGSGAPDPSMETGLVRTLKRICESNPNTDPTVFLDQNTSFLVDNEYYKQIIKGRGVLKIDQEIAEDKASFNMVSKLAKSGNVLFGQDFAKAMIKLGNINVLTGDEGEIRSNCRVFN
ncbi:hypothetical protein vseg_016513 [Gypsophila vaccaria]